MSADPDSFEETNFHAPKFQLQGAFTSDYRRVGPDIHGNLLVENSSNGLFVRITTPAGDPAKGIDRRRPFRRHRRRPHPVREPDDPGQVGRSDPGTGTPAGQRRDADSADRRYDGSRPRTTTRLSTSTRNGFEGRPSEATLPVTLAGANNAVKLDKLPAATGDFVARRLYRSVDGVAGPYVFVAQINASASVYVDRTALSSLDANNTLQRDVPTVRGVSLTPCREVPVRWPRAPTTTASRTSGAGRRREPLVGSDRQRLSGGRRGDSDRQSDPPQHRRI